MDLQKKEANFFKYGTPYPSIMDRLRGMFSRSVVNSAYQRVGFGYTAPSWNKLKPIEECFNKNPMVYSVVSKIARTCSLPPWGVYRVVDERAFNRYKSLANQPYVDTRELRIAKTKALVPEKSDKLDNLLTYPNENQSWADFIESLIGFKLLTGDAYAWADIIEYGANSGKPSGLYILPPQNMEIIAGKSFPTTIEGYVLRGEFNIPLEPDHVLHSKYWNPNYNSMGSSLYGFSPLQSAYTSTLGDNEAREAAIEIIQNRGVRGVLALESLQENPDLASETAGMLKERWRQTQQEDKGGIVPVAGKANYLRMGLSLEDMKILEIRDYTREDICNIYGVSSILFNNTEASTLDNFKIARKDLVSNVAIPELNRIKADLNRMMHTTWGFDDKSLIIDYDSSVYSELTEDVAETADWLSKAW